MWPGLDEYGRSEAAEQSSTYRVVDGLLFVEETSVTPSLCRIPFSFQSSLLLNKTVLVTSQIPSACSKYLATDLILAVGCSSTATRRSIHSADDPEPPNYARGTCPVYSILPITSLPRRRGVKAVDGRALRPQYPTFPDNKDCVPQVYRRCPDTGEKSLHSRVRVFRALPSRFSLNLAYSGLEER